MKLSERLKKLEDLSVNIDPAQARQRGLDFEKLIRDKFYKEGLLSIVKQTGYHTSDNKSEQIDGVINHNGRIFLLETKWSKKLAASSLYEFIGKIDNKFYGTLGIFISYNELEDNFINSLRRGRKQTVIVIHGPEDINLLFNENFSLEEFLNYSIEKLSFDNLSHVSISEFLKFSSNMNNKPNNIKISNANINNFINNYILIDKIINTNDIEVAFNKLSDNEQAKVYEIIFENSPNYLQFTLPIPASYSNTHNFIEIYRPDFNLIEIKDLPNKYFSEYIFKEPKNYLLNFIRIFIKEFPNINKSSLLKFEQQILGLFSQIDWEEENAITLIFEKYSEKISNEVINEVHKKYINFYYSSREDRFRQKSFSIKLINDKLIKKETILEWVKERMIDLEVFENKDTFSVSYFSKTYFDLGISINTTKSEWFELVKNIYKSII